MAEPLKITQMGDQLAVHMNDGSTRLAVPTGGDLWWINDAYTPPPPPPVDPPPSGGGGGARFQWPFDPRPYQQGGSVSSEYGPRDGRIHQGIDFGYNGATNGKTIPAAGAGRANLRRNAGFGNHVVIDHGDNLKTLYAHIQDGGFLISDGAQVAKGQGIGKIGNTGNSFGAHLHFETHVGNLNWNNPGSHMNPRDFMARYAG